MLSQKELDEFLALLGGDLRNVLVAEINQQVVNLPFKDKLISVQLDLGIIALLIADDTNLTINRVAMSDTELAHSADVVSAKPFHSMGIPVNTSNNIIAKAYSDLNIHKTDDWKDLFNPLLTEEEARFNQAAGGISCSLVAPFYGANKNGILVYDFYQPLDNMNEVHYSFVKDYTELVSNALNR